MKARLIATGERAPSWVAQGFAEYQKRLSHWLPFELVEIEPGLRGKGRDPKRAIDDEGRRVLAALPGSQVWFPSLSIAWSLLYYGVIGLFCLSEERRQQLYCCARSQRRQLLTLLLVGAVFVGGWYWAQPRVLSGFVNFPMLTDADGTDGAQLSFMGLPCPNLFTGGYNYHGKHEFVTLEGMEKAVKVIVRIAELTAKR